MKNTYNLSLVRRRIQEAMPRPLSTIGESALEAFLTVPGVSAWRPARLGLKELSFVFDIGLPFALIGDNPSAQSRRLRAGDAVRDGRYPERCLWNEIHVAAILSGWGAPVCFAAQNGALEVRLEQGETVAVDMLGTNLPERPSCRARLVVVDLRALPYEHGVGPLAQDGAAGADVVAIIGFEPRFWIGVQQKEWLYSIRLNPGANVTVPATMLGNADGRRHSMRFPLLV